MDLLFSPIRAIQDWIGDALSGDDSIQSQRSLGIVSILTFPVRLLWGFAVFMVQAWTTSRNNIAFIRGMPALAILAFTPFLIWVLNNYSRQISLSPTMGYHQMHRRNGNFEAAKLFSSKMVQLKPESKEFKYLLAEDIGQLGDLDAAKRMMSFLAGSLDDELAAMASGESLLPAIDPESEADEPEGLSGDSLLAQGDVDDEDEDEDEGREEEETDSFARAHVWLSQQLLREQQLNGFDEKRNDLAMAHLRAAIKLDPDDMTAKLNLVQLYDSRAQQIGEGNEGYRENLELSRGVLRQITAYKEFFNIQQVLAMPRLVEVNVKLGDEVAAKRALDRMTGKVTRLARLNPTFFEIWNSLVRSAVAVKDYDKALDFIKEGRRAATEEARPRLTQLASLISLQNADDFPDLENEEHFRKRLFALCKAIASNPRDTQIYDRLMDYIDIDQGGPQRDSWLRNSILDSPISGVCHIILGMRELARDNIVQGQAHWDIAQQQFGSTEFVVHRLLSVAVRRDKKYIEGQMVTKAIEMFPDQTMLYETRGTINKMAGEYEVALQDFEYVVKKSPESLSIHKHLADCYAEIGQSDKAQIHQARVREILDALDEKDREIYEAALESL